MQHIWQGWVSPQLMEEAERNGSVWGEVLSKIHSQVTNGHRKLFLSHFFWVGWTVVGLTAILSSSERFCCAG